MERAAHRPLAITDVESIYASEIELHATIMLGSEVDRAQMGGAGDIEPDLVAAAVKKGISGGVNEGVEPFLDVAVGFDRDVEDAVPALGLIGAGAATGFDFSDAFDGFGGIARGEGFSAKNHADRGKRTAAGRAPLSGDRW